MRIIKISCEEYDEYISGSYDVGYRGERGQISCMWVDFSLE